MNIPINGTFSFRECLWFLNRNFDDCMHTTGVDYVRKAILINDQPVLFEIREGKQELVVSILHGNNTAVTQKAIEDFIHEWFDLSRDLSQFYDQLSSHKDVSYMSRDFAGLRLIGIPDLFEAICWCIIGQQINLTFAYKTKRRLVEKYGGKVTYEGQDYYTFPSPEALADASPDILREMQFSGQKVVYLIGIATVFKEERMSKALLLALPDVAAQQKALTAIKGIGIWTANYTLMKTLRIPSSIPYGDAGLLNALIAHKIISDKKDLDALNEFFRYFKGWESYLVFYLWRSLAPQNG
ncbi:DNA-3-methyladenine glycosylase II [Chitinophaga sp. CF118]|uniref:DNA-3-methyladenine glycosylase family protein n=1 Tax=Chitinophaga sp. CF118 TaxID=1884367 RepID=UPI0008E0FF66|nr:DNA glycosylase [Chitinophaga sp. CF118]SFD84503.1 DNA-3-methyladenine glycosylase II [Chitinophaga sp. CF118]